MSRIRKGARSSTTLPTWTALLVSFIVAPILVCWVGLVNYMWSTLPRKEHYTAEVQGRPLTKGDRVTLKEGESADAKDVLRPGEVGTIEEDHDQAYIVRGPRGDAKASFKRLWAPPEAFGPPRGVFF